MYYFDNNSTTLIPNNIMKKIQPWISVGNPSNTNHFLGIKAKKKIEQCRKDIAKHFKVQSNNIYFTSGATESNNIAINGLIQNCKGKHIISSAFEHKSVLNTLENLKKKGYKITYVKPNKHGIILPQNVEKAIRKNTCLITVMHSNNELGTLQNIKKISQIAKKNKILFHTDATQTVGKYKIDLNNITALSFSGHKFCAQKGIGGLYIKNGFKCVPRTFGGMQEKSLRPGTENVAGIVGLAVALKHAHINRDKKNMKIKKMHEYILNLFDKKDIKYKLLGHPTQRNYNTMLMAFDIKCNKKLINYLNNKKICLSIGSACNTSSKYASHVLNSIGASKDIKRGTIRISLSEYNTKMECEYLVDNIINFVK